jgi:acetyltransferase-like isoleucine patch superfamily enzyme
MKEKYLMKVKSIGLKIVKRVPNNSLRIFLLKTIFGYSIGKNVKIGKGIINCNKVVIGDNVYIANNNLILCNELFIGSKTSIHSGNVIHGNANFFIGTNSRIINNHFFDLHHNILIGNNTWIAGKNSQFWTHGSIYTKCGTKDLSITIKNDIYIGSACCFAPGVVIGNENLVGLGSVVTNKFLESKTIIAGNPASVVRQDIDWRVNW